MSEMKYKLVMIIDDNQIDRYVAEVNLRKGEICERILLMESGGEALQYLRSHSEEPAALPQLILLDIRMPDMDGFEFIEEYSLLPEALRENRKIYMLSSTIDPGDLMKIKTNPIIAGLLNKPLTKSVVEQL